MNDDFLAGATELLGSPGLLIGSWGFRNLAYDPDIYGHELPHIVTAETNPLDLTLTETGLSRRREPAAAGPPVSSTSRSCMVERRMDS